jgi:8-hydroxy-5-deazaflavin:NADPH oxidoreductase
MTNSQVMRIAILGTGGVGLALARALSTVGHDVTLGSRTPGAHDALPARVLSYADAARAAEVVVNATPGRVSLQTLTAVVSTWLDGKILLDAANAGTDDGELLYPKGSLAERLQQAFPGARVVKALSTVNTSVMTAPGILPVSTTAFIADAKRTVAELIVDLGWPGRQILDLGELTSAWAIEHYYPLFLATYQALRTLRFNIAVVTESTERTPPC